jgi:hypothetical protein
MSDRKPGFYWVKARGPLGWIVAEWGGLNWSAGFWSIAGMTDEWRDADFAEIDERRIERQA